MALAVPIPEFRRLIDERISMCRALVDVLCERMREGTDQVLELGTDDALTRVGRRLVEFGQSGGTRTAAGLVVERGGTLSHGAIVARDFGIPAVVCPNATSRMAEGRGSGSVETRAPTR